MGGNVSDERRRHIALKRLRGSYRESNRRATVHPCPASRQARQRHGARQTADFNYLRCAEYTCEKKAHATFAAAQRAVRSIGKQDATIDSVGLSPECV